MQATFSTFQIPRMGRDYLIAKEAVVKKRCGVWTKRKGKIRFELLTGPFQTKERTGHPDEALHGVGGVTGFQQHFQFDQSSATSASMR